MINLTMLSFRELTVLAEHHAHKTTTDEASRAYILELLNRSMAQALRMNKDIVLGQHNRIEGA
jgi:hypothetical protein